MRFYEISVGLDFVITKEEEDILSLFYNRDKLYKHTLDERNQEVIRLMVSKGMLDRKSDEKGLYFTMKKKDVWRI